VDAGLIIVLYCVGIVLASLLGGMLPRWIRLTHTRLQLMMSLVAGFMLGIALLHLLPHALAEAGPADRVTSLVLAGLLVTFGLIRVFGVHHHGAASTDPIPSGVLPHPAALSPRAHMAHDHRHHEHSDPSDGGGHEHSHHEHSHHEHSDHEHSRQGVDAPEHAAAETTVHVHSVAWVGLALGLALHALLDGVAVAASVIADARHAPGPGPWGGGTFLAVALHKPLDALSVAAVIRAGGGSLRKVNVVNVGFALMGPVGAAVFWLSGGGLGGVSHQSVGMVLAFAAGVFLCVALADILPEVRFHAHDRLSLSVALLLGVALAWMIGWVEPDAAHEGHRPAATAHPESHVHP
jgi:zinc and cadmium transporter